MVNFRHSMLGGVPVFVRVEKGILNERSEKNALQCEFAGASKCSG